MKKPDLQPADCLQVGNWATGDTGGFDMPRTLRIRLDTDSVEALEAAMQVRSFANRTYGDGLVRRMELAFPGVGVLEYLREDAAGNLRTWHGQYDEPSIRLNGDGIEFVAKVAGSDLVFQSDNVDYAVLIAEIRKWRSMMFGQTIDEAMPGEAEPTQRRASSPSPL